MNEELPFTISLDGALLIATTSLCVGVWLGVRLVELCKKYVKGLAEQIISKVKEKDNE